MDFCVNFFSAFLGAFRPFKRRTEDPHRNRQQNSQQNPCKIRACGEERRRKIHSAGRGARLFALLPKSRKNSYTCEAPGQLLLGYFSYFWGLFSRNSGSGLGGYFLSFCSRSFGAWGFGSLCRLRKLYIFSIFSATPGKSPGYPLRQKKLGVPWVSKDIPNFLAPHPFTWKKISGQKSLGLGSFFLPDPCSWSGVSQKTLHRASGPGGLGSQTAATPGGLQTGCGNRGSVTQRGSWPGMPSRGRTEATLALAKPSFWGGSHTLGQFNSFSVFLQSQEHAHFTSTKGAEKVSCRKTVVLQNARMDSCVHIVSTLIVKTKTLPF